MFRNPVGINPLARLKWVRPTTPKRQISSLRVLSNIKMISGQIFHRRGGTFIKRVGIIIGAYLVINVMFNAMLFGLSVNYIGKIQNIPKSFELRDKYKFFQSVISDDVLMKPREAHAEYKLLLDKIGNDVGLLDKDDEFVGGYCDLLLRYALSSNDENELQLYISKLFDIIDERKVGNLTLQNQALRTVLALQPDTATSELYYKRAVQIIAQVDDVEFGDKFAVIPSGVVISDTMLQSLLDLVYFYTDHKLQMSESLGILLSILRSLECKRKQKLLDLQKSNSSTYQTQITKLETETMPLIKSNISELLWFDQNYELALKWAQESSLESLINARENYNSARICKNGFKNLSKMYLQMGKKEESQLCLSRSEDINLLIPINDRVQPRLRDVVLNHYFGYWGKVLFP